MSDGGFRSRSPVSRARIAILVAGTATILVVYSVALFRMQVVEGYLWLNRAEQTARRSVPIFARRGEIRDRTGVVELATSRSSFAVTAVPAELRANERDAILARVAEITGTPLALMSGRLANVGRASYDPVEIATGIDLSTVSRIAEEIDRLPGIGWYAKPERDYPVGSLAAHVVGYVGDITPAELQVLFNEGYTRSSTIGKSGVEQQYDRVLRGQDGVRFQTVDARGRRVGDGGDVIPPVRGNDIHLTIDVALQELAVRALGPRLGSVVVMSPSNGDILALVSYPSFDPRSFLHDDPDGRSFQSLSQDRRAPFLARPLQSVAAPASTFKIVMTTAILGENAFPPDETILCTGTFPYGNRIFNDWLEVGHGPMDLRGALAQSCNVYYWNMGSSHVGVDQIIDYSAQLGLGRETGIDLPGEVPGLIPSPAWKERTFGQPWVGGDTVNMSIGEGYLQVTPLQMAVATATIVNDGATPRPRVVRRIVDGVSGADIPVADPEFVRTAEIPPDVFEEVRSAMRGVITDGTAEVVITTSAVDAAGKTGTGQVGSDVAWNSWFVAYAPYGEDVPPDQQIVLVVMVEGSNEWEWWAPKAANVILHGWATGLGYDEAVEDLRRGPRPLWYL